MAKMQKTVSIQAPLQKVFDYSADPNNLPKFWHSISNIHDVQDAGNGGKNFAWSYKMAGINVEGASRTTEFIPNQRIVTQSTKGIESHFVWTYQPENSGTKVTVEVEYVVPIPVLGKLAEAIIVKQNEQDAEDLLKNLKTQMEA
jgi:uncharacterized membrane protein